jgi:hypothetical protein
VIENVERLGPHHHQQPFRPRYERPLQKRREIPDRITPLLFTPATTLYGSPEHTVITPPLSTKRCRWSKIALPYSIRPVKFGFCPSSSGSTLSSVWLHVQLASMLGRSLKRWLRLTSSAL